LGHPDAVGRLAGQDLREVAVLLGLRPVSEDRWSHLAVAEPVGGEGRASGEEQLGEGETIDEAASPAAVADRPPEAGPPRRHHAAAHAGGAAAEAPPPTDASSTAIVPAAVRTAVTIDRRGYCELTDTAVETIMKENHGTRGVAGRAAEHPAVRPRARRARGGV